MRMRSGCITSQCCAIHRKVECRRAHTSMPSPLKKRANGCVLPCQVFTWAAHKRYRIRAMLFAGSHFLRPNPGCQVKSTRNVLERSWYDNTGVTIAVRKRPLAAYLTGRVRLWQFSSVVCAPCKRDWSRRALSRALSHTQTYTYTLSVRGRGREGGGGGGGGGEERNAIHDLRHRSGQ